MNTFEQQELRARARVSLSAVVKAGLIAGLLVFVLPGGGPWMSVESGYSAMGRIVSLSPVVAGITQTVLALIYGFVIASVMYRMHTFPGILVGTALGFVLFGANMLFMPIVSREFAVNELHVLIAHVVFALFFSVIYRAMAVPTVKELKDSHA